MIVALATLAFLAAGWAAFYAVVMTSDDSAAKITAALRGKSLIVERMMLRPVTVRFAARSAPQAKTMRAKAEWRAAA